MLRALRGGTSGTSHVSNLIRLAAQTRWPRDAHLAAILREALVGCRAVTASFETAEGERIALELGTLADDARVAVLADHAQFARNAINGRMLLTGDGLRGRSLLAVPVDTDEGWRALCLSAEHPFLDEDVANARVAADVLARVAERRPEGAVDTVMRDPLTRLANRDATFARIEESLHGAARHGGRVAVLYIDLDGFKSINDQHGHAAGDATLVELARRMSAALRRDELIGRLGGDEFAAVLPNVAGLEEVLNAAERLAQRVADPVDVDGTSLSLSASFGIAISPDDGDSPATLLANADAAMYQAKRDGRGAIRMFGENVASEMRARRDLRDRLRTASVERDFLLCFQPVVGAESGRVIGAEALVRWIHPSRGLLSPRSFFAIAETMRMSSLLDAWVVGSAMRSLQPWLAAGLDPVINVNVSAADGSVSEEIRRLVRDEGLDARRLRIEMSESNALGNVDATLQFFEDLQRIGVRTGIDGFGAGHTSLHMLATLPLDFIKLDRSLTAPIGDDAAGMKLALVAISIARAFGIAVSADSIESSEQTRWLAANGVTEVQGYGIAQPMIAPDFLHWWQQHNTLAPIAVRAPL